MAVTLDLMEYADDPTIQVVYPTNGHHAVTFAGTAQLDTAEKKFGTASVLFDGNSDYLSLIDSPDWDISTDFTISVFLKFADHAGSETILGQWEADTDRWILNHVHGLGFQFFIESGDTTIVVINWGTEITDTNWHHVALCKVGNEYGLYVGGTQSAYVNDASMDTFTGPLYIGATKFLGSFVDYFQGHMDDFWISHDNFFGAAPNGTPDNTITVPTAPRQTDTNCKLLLHFDGGDGVQATLDWSRLEPVSEDTIKEQGTYSLKGFAKGTDSLNDTLTRTISAPIDLTGLPVIKVDIRASRTGSNIKIGIHDTGGVTTEHTANIASANVWQTEEWNISAVAAANKDAIDSIIITITNADDDNTFYIDNMFGDIWRTALTRKLGLKRAHVSMVSEIDTRTLGLTRSFTLGPGHLSVIKKLGLKRSHVSTTTGVLTRKLGLKRSLISTITGVLTRKLGLARIHVSTVSKYIVELKFYNRSGTLVKIISSKSQNFPLIEPGLDFAFTRNGGCGAFSFTTSEDLSLEYNFRCDIYLYETKWFSGYLTKLPQVGTGLTYRYEGWGFVEQIDWQTINETFTSEEVSAIAESILDDYIVPNTDIKKAV